VAPTSAQVVQQRAAQLELEDQRRQVQELSKAKKQLETEVSELRDRLELEVITKNEEASESPCNCLCVGGSNSVTCFKAPNVSCKPGYKTWRSLPLLLPPFILVGVADWLRQPKLTIPTELQEAVNSYKAKAESYLAKLEEAEIARVKSARAESLGSIDSHMDL
jgi:myosin protein heavy chain